MPQVPLPQPLLDIINEWFCLVDDDGSGSLSAAELEMAFLVRFLLDSNRVLQPFCWGYLVLHDITMFPPVAYCSAIAGM